MNRRAFLKSTVASAAILAMPALPAAPALIGIAGGTDPTLHKVFVVGTPGEFDWKAFIATSEAEAKRLWSAELGYDEDDAQWVEAEHIEKWDGLDPDLLDGADWLKAGLGYCCDRCGNETHRETGARAICGEAICEGCLTIADLCLVDRADAVDRLADEIVNHDYDVDELRNAMEQRDEPDIPPDIWIEAVKLAEDSK